MSNKAFYIIPYLTFGGNCEEAMKFYAKIFDGESVVINRYDNPAMKAPESYKDKILHARLLIDNEVILYASDVFPGKEVSGSSGDISLSIMIGDNVDRARRVFAQLAEGGKTGVPFDKQFWGDWHGNLVDRYGMKWNINFEEKK